MDESKVRAARDQVEELAMAGEFGPVHPAGKAILQSVNDTSRLLGQYGGGELEPEDMAKVKRDLDAKLIELAHTAGQNRKARQPLKDYISAVNDALGNPKAKEASDSGGIITGDTDVKGDMSQ